MAVNLRELKQVGPKYSEKRRGRRMNSRVEVRLEWDSEPGKRHSVETHTRIVIPTAAWSCFPNRWNSNNVSRSPISRRKRATLPLWCGEGTVSRMAGSTAWN